MSAGGSRARGRSPAHLGTGDVLLPALPLSVPHLPPAAPLKPCLFFPEPALLQGFALDPQAVCVLSIHSLLREDEFGEAFLLFPGARFLHSRGVLGAWSWWHSQVAELVGSAFGKERAIPQHLWGSVASTEERGRDGLLYPVESQGLAEEVQ